MELKKCSKCGNELPLNEEFFTKRKDSKDGFKNLCKNCIAKNNKKWRNSNNEHLLKYKKMWRESHKEFYKKIKKQYRDDNKEYFRIKKHERNAKKRELSHTLTAEQWEDCVGYFNNCCAYCGRDEKLTQDHVIAVANGGGYEVGNIIPACIRCNCSKHANDVWDWYKKQPFYSEEREKNILTYLEMVTDNQIDESAS